MPDYRNKNNKIKPNVRAGRVPAFFIPGPYSVATSPRAVEYNSRAVEYNSGAVEYNSRAAP
jgi:hypothetical protein